MRYTIENDELRLTVDSRGAEAVSAVNKRTGAEMLWQADPAVWGRHAPILFPYTGKLTGGRLEAKGRTLCGRPARLCPRRGTCACAAGGRYACAGAARK